MPCTGMQPNRCLASTTGTRTGILRARNWYCTIIHNVMYLSIIVMWPHHQALSTCCWLPWGGCPIIPPAACCPCCIDWPCRCCWPTGCPGWLTPPIWSCICCWSCCKSNIIITLYRIRRNFHQEKISSPAVINWRKCFHANFVLR